MAMPEPLKIFTEQLRDERHEKIQATLPPEFLELSEKEVSACSPVVIEGEAYALDELLMVEVAVRAEIEMVCSVCNRPVRVTLENKNILISIPFSELPSSVFDCSTLIREEIVMLIPQFIECKQEGCPERQVLKQYLKSEKKHEAQNFPFAGLD